jgi:hypothetical protein
VAAGVLILKEPFSALSAAALAVILIGIWGVQKFSPERKAGAKAEMKKRFISLILVLAMCFRPRRRRAGGAQSGGLASAGLCGRRREELSGLQHRRLQLLPPAGHSVRPERHGIKIFRGLGRREQRHIRDRRRGLHGGRHGDERGPGHELHRRAQPPDPRHKRRGGEPRALQHRRHQLLPPAGAGRGAVFRRLLRRGGKQRGHNQRQDRRKTPPSR